MPDLLFFLLLGHVSGDFALQSDEVAQRKRTSPAILTLHVTIYTATIALSLLAAYLFADAVTVMRWVTLPVLAFIFAEHWIQDFFKVNGAGSSKQVFYVDQVIHIAILYVIRLTVYHG